MELEDYQKMAEGLAGIKAQFILSINDMSEMRTGFQRFQYGACNPEIFRLEGIMEKRQGAAGQKVLKGLK
jgi:hypothetical protein